MWCFEAVECAPADSAAALMFSFRVDDEPAARVLANWSRSATAPVNIPGGTRTTTAWRDPASGLCLRCVADRFSDSPAVAWTLYFSHEGRKQAPLLADLQDLDLRLDRPPGCSAFRLHAARGGVCTPADFEPLEHVLTPGTRCTLEAAGGRSSNYHLPFFNVDGGTGGMMIAVGWSGQWAAHLAADAAGDLHVQAGLARTHLRLRPGETVRGPRILLLPWEGEHLAGHNLLRAFIRRHVAPPLAGAPPLPPTQCNTWFPVGDDGGKANEQNQIALLEACAPLGLEYLVIDAGWYGDSPIWYHSVGTWTTRRDTFPRGLGPVGAAAQRLGMKVGLWFELERVRAGTALDREHPEWLVRLDGQENRLLNLGLPAARKWCEELVARYVQEVPLGYYRHDHNFDPLPYWESADAAEAAGAADRVSATERHYIAGLYDFWDYLRTRFPELLMEGCASGGRRIDLESLARCHTYWITDYWRDLTANQNHNHGAGLFLPGNYLNKPWFDTGANPYGFYSQLGGALCLGADPRAPDFDVAGTTARVARFKALRHLFVGDFYALRPYSLSPDAWAAWQYHRRDLDEGAAIFLRRAESPFVAMATALRGLTAGATYEITWVDSGETRTLSGAALADGITVTIAQAPGAALVTYRRAGDTPG